MIQEIKYNGHTAQPADNASQDGDLSLSMGVIQEDGALRPVLRPKMVRTDLNASRLLYVHKTTSFTHFILQLRNQQGQKSKVLVFSDAESGEQKSLRGFGDVEIRQLTHVGNTLMVLASDGIHYFLWKGEDGGYKYLGTHMPELPLSFGLQGSLVTSGDTTSAYKGLKGLKAADDEKFKAALAQTGNEFRYNEGTGTFDLYDKASLADARARILGVANKLIADQVHGKGKFCFPFFVRYAYRLYDQTLTMHSAPVLMLASNPEVSAVWKEMIGQTESTGGMIIERYRLRACASQLDWNLARTDALEPLKEWSDIIKSVDVFISAPIYNYDQQGEYAYTFLKDIPKGQQFVVGMMDGDGEYKRHNLTEDSQSFDLSRTPDKVKDDIRNCSSFYLLKSMELSDIPSERKVIEIDGDYLASIETRETMTDDYDSHHNLFARTAFPYNNRLSLGNISKELFPGYPAGSMFQHTNKSYMVTKMSVPDTETATFFWRLRKDGRVITVGGDSAVYGFGSPYDFLFYPDTNAFEVVIKIVAGGDVSTYVLPLRKHDYLNGSYYYGGWTPWDNLASTSVDTTLSENRVFSLPNRIYTSLVDNPFSFPAANIATIGAGEVLALAVAKQAMSPSQFGHFPLYAFTSEGVWAMTVSSEGALNPAQPITSDVITNPDGLAALDNTVMYATSRGVMLLSGSQSQCISDQVNGGACSLSDLPKGDVLFGIYKEQTGDNDRMKEKGIIPFLDFIRKSKILYDYTHQHVLIFNKDESYAYVYSLKSNFWGMIAVPAYRDVVATSGPGSYVTMPYIERLDGVRYNGIAIYNFDESDGEMATALIVTRPFKLGQPFEFKTVDTIIQRGAMARDAVRQVLYGTNDFRHWFTVWSSGDIYMRGFRGTPYKAYRLAMVAKLGSEDSLYGCTVQFNMRLMNQPR